MTIIALIPDLVVAFLVGLIALACYHNLPIVDIPMMSDERWNQLCRESTLENYRKYSGRGEAPDYETALKWEKEFFESDKPVENIKAPRIRQDTQGATIIDF